LFGLAENELGAIAIARKRLSFYDPQNVKSDMVTVGARERARKVYKARKTQFLVE
jgi:hypothetical protein